MLFLRCLGIEGKGNWGEVMAELEKPPPELDIKCNSKVQELVPIFFYLKIV